MPKSLLVRETNEMETIYLIVSLEIDLLCPYSLGKLMKWKLWSLGILTSQVNHLSLLVRETNEMETEECNF